VGRKQNFHRYHEHDTMSTLRLVSGNSPGRLLRHSITDRSYSPCKCHQVAAVSSLTFPHGHKTLLPLVNSCNNLSISSIGGSEKRQVQTRNADGTLSNKEIVVPFVLRHDREDRCRRPLGYLRPHVLDRIVEEGNKWILSPWSYRKCSDGTVESVAFEDFHFDEGKDNVPTFYLEEMVRRWKTENTFPEILKGSFTACLHLYAILHIIAGWSNENFPVFHDVDQAVKNPIAFTIERAALPLFGFPNYGSLLVGKLVATGTSTSSFLKCAVTAYYRDTQTGEKVFWVPRRSKTKRT
jgi:hypothetical protein